jgi:hypothetical protein
MPHSKKGRLAGGARKEINSSRASDAVFIAMMTDTEREAKKKRIDFIFARVTKMVGGNHVRVAIESKRGPREINARIPNIFGRRGATPITTRTIVSLYTGVAFDSDKSDSSEHFDITSILTDRQATELVKAKLIPDWMMASDAEATKAGKPDEDGFEWDYDAVATTSNVDEYTEDISGCGSGHINRRYDVVEELDNDLDIDDI